MEQMTISLDPSVVSLQCSSQRTPIIDPSVKEDDTNDDIAKNLLNTKGTTRSRSKKKFFRKIKKIKIP